MPENYRRSRRPRRPALHALVVVLVLSLVLAACGDDDDNGGAAGGGNGTATTAPGGGGGGAVDIDTENCETDPETVTIEGDTIKLGTSLPQSGLYSTFKEILNGAQAYIDYVNNTKGGVTIAGKQYKIELVAKDDAYTPSRTTSNVNSLLNSDNVFALFNVVGTRNNAAIRDNVNDACVPNLFAATGSPLWGNRDYPWMIGTYLVPYPLEMQALVDYLKENDPDATIAVLRADDDFGLSYLETLKALIDGTQMRIVGEQTYNPESFDTKTQVTSLAASDADVFVLGATLLACPDALRNVGTSNWKPLIYMSGTCTSKTLMGAAKPYGDQVLSVAPLMDPADPQWDSNEAMALYKREAAKKAQDVENGIVAYGWTVAALLEHTLGKAEAPNRLAVMEAARTLSDVRGIALQLPDATWSVGADDWFLGEEFNLVQYSDADGHFKPVGPLKKFGDRTEEITPDNLVNS
jgi:branched-chain amino acid transport system substrate-binding protein